MIEDDSELAARMAVRGRGTGELAKGRFEKLETVYAQEEERQVKTELFRDASRSVLSFNDSPDVGVDVTLNPYRGCEHGCIYCYARPTHEYLGLSAGLDFETKIFAKTDAPDLLRKNLESKSWKPRVITLSGVTDCYQPIERKLGLTRQCLDVLADCRNPVAIITKNHLVTRDIDVLQRLAKYNAALVVLSITTLDGDLARMLEPRASRPQRRLDAVRELAQAGIPVSVNMAPIIPGLTDHEIPAALEAAAQAGARRAHYTLVRLPYGVKDLFSAWLDAHAPTKKQKILNRIRDTRGGELYKAEFGSRMRGEGIYAEHIARMFARYRKLYGLDQPMPPLSTAHLRRPRGDQGDLFDRT